MGQFVQPAKDDITLTGVLGALADPVRLHIFRTMMKEKKGEEISCRGAAPGAQIAKSTISNHFRILREAGLVHTEKKGVEHRNTIREEEINARFPGLLNLILELSDDHPSPHGVK